MENNVILTSNTMLLQSGYNVWPGYDCLDVREGIDICINGLLKYCTATAPMEGEKYGRTVDFCANGIR